MRNTLLQIVFTIPLLILVSCISLPSTRSMTSPTETPNNTFTPSPTATITPNFTSTQQAVDLQETQIAKETQTEILAQETQVAIEATARAEATKQAQEALEKEQIDKFYNAAKEQLGIEIVKDPELISNNSKVLSFYLSQKLFDKNINSIHFYKEFQDLYGYYLLGRIAGQHAYYYDQAEFANLDKYVGDKCTMWDLEGWSLYAKIKLLTPYEIPIQGVDIRGQQVNTQVNHVEVSFVSKREFEQLLELAKEQELPFLYRGEFNRKKAMIMFQGAKMVVIGYDYDPGWPMSVEYIGNWFSNEDKFIYFQQSINPVFSATLMSLAGDRLAYRRDDPNFTSECDLQWHMASTIMPMKPGNRENSSICSRMNCDKIADQTFR